MTSSNSSQIFIQCYSIGWMTKGLKYRWCMEEIKMKNHIVTNASLCLLNDHSEDMVFTWFFSIRWAKIRLYIRRMMAREEKHWEVENSNMALSHKKDGKLWSSYFQCRSEIQMKNLLIIMFCEIDNKKRPSSWCVHPSSVWTIPLVWHAWTAPLGSVCYIHPSIHSPK
jgi:hypothetical protein